MTNQDDLNNEPRGDGELILIIDDESSFVEITKILLTNSGYTILTAKNGFEGIVQFKNNIQSVKVIVCDLNMPKMGGNTAVQTFLSLNPEIKILIISGSVEEDKIPKYLEPGKIEFLHKPFMTETLLQILARLLGKRNNNRPEVL